MAAATSIARGDAVPATSAVRRVASAVVLIPLVVWATLAGPELLFHAVVVALAAAAAWELGRMFERSGRATNRWLDAVLSAFVVAAFLVPEGTLLVLSTAILIALVAPLVRRTALGTDATATTLLAVTYCGWLLGHAILVRELPEGRELILLLLGITWAGDSAAYVVGSTLGRHKLAPVVSPNKTMEGAVAQVVAALGAALALRPWLAPDWTPAFALIAGALLGVVGQVGDLAESVLKRSLGTKDTGGLIPGHGGVLDRLDSLMFNLPAFYYLVTLGGRA
jgi:phosphatidate cytidylyltransferase